MKEAAFLATILHDPDDRATRLVYADWLKDHDDPRGELIRIEDEMRTLPAFADRFWQLKPRRNQLRAKAGTHWLEVMGYGTDCLPLFGHGIPEGWKERWRLIREFVERWHGIPLGDVGGRGEEVRAAEVRLARALPPSVREWIAFAHDVGQDPLSLDLLRDVRERRELEGHSALSLLLQGGVDSYWRARYTDLTLADPPVAAFRFDYQNQDENTFVPDERNPYPPTLTAFALENTISYTNGKGGGFGTQVAEPAGLIRDLERTFLVHHCLGEMDVFEADNILVRLYPSPETSGKWFIVDVAKPLPPEVIPLFVWEYGHYDRGMVLPRNHS
jgi:uncharacterized protein (TIGR02996 family)